MPNQDLYTRAVTDVRICGGQPLRFEELES
jgi:hypothetical protein